MHPLYNDKKIVDLTEEEARTLSFLGTNVSVGIHVMVEKARANPTYLGFLTCFGLEILHRRHSAPPPPPPPEDPPESPSTPTPSTPTTPTITEVNTLFSRLSTSSTTLTVVAPDLISTYEAKFWYHGLSGDPPKLIWRSDLEINPFPHPRPNDRFFKIPSKTVHGVFDTPLNIVWDTVAPKIIASIKARGIAFSALTAARFSTLEERDGREDKTLGPVVVWIAVRPDTTTAQAVRDATPDILAILAEANVTHVLVEWYEGSVQRLVDLPPETVHDTTSPSPSVGLNHEV